MSAACPVFGFVVTFELVVSTGAARLLEFERVLSSELLDPRGLQAIPARPGSADAYIVRSEASQATDADRVAVQMWARSRPEIRAAHVGPLVDLAAVP